MVSIRDTLWMEEWKEREILNGKIIHSMMDNIKMISSMDSVSIQALKEKYTMVDGKME